MCGIAGIFSANKNEFIDPKILIGMAAIQAHRGPDDFGLEIPKDWGIGLSHCRLSIIDLDEERARQPFISQDRNLLLVHNGEFYNYKKIRADLTSRGAKFKTKSDSEILLHLYSGFGLDKTIPFLRGEFAFALFDHDREQLFLVRDRFGIKPLYWTNVNGQIVFGSEVKAIFAHPKVPRKLNPQNTLHQLMQITVPGTTAFDQIHQIKPGHLICFKRNLTGSFDIKEQKYWDINFPHLKDSSKIFSEDYYIEGVREKLLEGVQLRLEADVPVACYLSGGIDSCSILGLAAATQQSPVKAFTIGFDDENYDESEIAKEMAIKANAEQDILRVNANHLYDHFVETMWHTERTIYNTLGVAKFLMSKHVHESGYKVVVTGEGSDELFGGYPAFRKDMYLHLKNEKKHHELLIQNKLFQGSMLAEKEHHAPCFESVLGFTPSCLQTWLSTEKLAFNLLSKDYQMNLKDYDPADAILNEIDRSYIEDRHPLDQSQYLWIKTMLEGQILTWGGDRVDMANSMESRPAFLDHYLAEFASQIPPQFRIKGTTEKYVLREAMKGLLPKTLYEREKFAFMAPPAFRDPKKWHALLKLKNEFLPQESIKEAGLLNPENVELLFKDQEFDKDHSPDQVQKDALINHTLGIQILYHQFIKWNIPTLAQERAKKLGWLQKSESLYA